MDYFFKPMLDFRYLGNSVLNLEHLTVILSKVPKLFVLLEVSNNRLCKKKITSELTIKNS